ncbi:MAG: hypothetical protein LBV26_08230 [Bacteroidales bacterium]|jgi:hypothetical protein|nr:hypothetical protein [Bacteroidales bacterium]
MKTKITLLLFCVLTSTAIFAQKGNTEIGITGGLMQFETVRGEFLDFSNPTIQNGFGWSAGIFAENYWKPKIHPIVEVNFYNYSSYIFSGHPFSSYYYSPEMLYLQSAGFSSKQFSDIAVSGGIKYLFSKKLFVYPGVELAWIFNSDNYKNKTNLNLKLGGGVNFKRFDVMLEYSHGLQPERTSYDKSADSYTSEKHNTYLQLKVQVPVYRLK